MENNYKKSISLSEHKTVAFIKPGINNLNSTNKLINKKNDLKKILFKTPSKTPLQLSAKKKTPNAGIINDRYIPNRNGANMEISYHLMQKITNIIYQNSNESSNENELLVDNIKRKLISDTCSGIQEKAKILNLHNKPDVDQSYAETMKSLYKSSSLNSLKKTTNRFIPTSPERILDAPDFRDDYYLNLIDWSSFGFLAVALNKEMYLWNSASGAISQLFSIEEESSDYITSTAWIQDRGNILAVGNSKSVVELWDVNRQTCIRQMKSHVTRVGSLSWNQHILSSGSRSGTIHHHDVRVAKHHVGTLKMHDQEVCGLKWSHDGRYLASGGNDNLVAVWDANLTHENQPLYVLREHAAAVKAVSWCPWQNNVLATGGGTADGKIKIWNIYNGNVLHSIDAKAQISCILWSKEFKEIISSHGYQLNQLTIWKYPEMVKVCDLTGHTNRVLMMAMSPDEEKVVSAGADETLRIWKCFGLDEKQRKAKESLSRADQKSASQTTLARCIR